MPLQTPRHDRGSESVLPHDLQHIAAVDAPSDRASSACAVVLVSHGQIPCQRMGAGRVLALTEAPLAIALKLGDPRRASWEWNWRDLQSHIPRPKVRFAISDGVGGGYSSAFLQLDQQRLVVVSLGPAAVPRLADTFRRGVPSPRVLQSVRTSFSRGRYSALAAVKQTHQTYTEELARFRRRCAQRVSMHMGSAFDLR